MVLAVSIQKGGVGKTTTAAVLSQAAAYRGQSVLAIDMDPQGNLSLPLGADPRRPGAAALLQGVPAADLIQRTEQGIDFIAGGSDTAAIKPGKGSAHRLRKALQAVRGKYDLIVIDTPAAPGEPLFNALIAADCLAIPIEADLYSLNSLYQTIDTARQIQQVNTGLQLSGIIITSYNNRTRIAQQMRQGVIDAAAGAGVPCLGSVRAAVALPEAVAFGRSLYEYAPKSAPAQDYLQVYDNLKTTF